MQAPLPDTSVDVVISQEALLHVPDKERALAEAYRILKPGGCIALTDWVAHQQLSGVDKQLMWQGMAVAGIYILCKLMQILFAELVLSLIQSRI